jgi:uncharacterized protein (TIGR02099 family)
LTQAFKNFCHRLVHRILYVVAGIVVFCAVIFTLTRAMTPLLTMHRATFERWTSSFLGRTVHVQQVSFGWHGIEPEMWLKGVDVFSKNGKTKTVHINNFYVALNVFKSLYHHQWIPSVITLSGVDLSIHQYPNGSFKVNDIVLAKTTRAKTTMDVPAIEQWVLKESHLYFQQLHINFISATKHVFSVQVKQLNFTNDHLYHQLAGKMTIAQGARKPAIANLIIQAKGNLFDYKHINAKLYLNFQNARLKHWITAAHLGYWVHAGVAKGGVWLTLKKGRCVSSAAQLQLLGLSLHSLKTGAWFRLPSLSGDFSLNRKNTPQGERWTFVADKLNIISKTKVWPETQLFFHVQKKKNASAQYHLWWRFANIADVRSLLLGSSVLPEKAYHVLSANQLSGQIEQADFSLDPAKKQWQVSGDFSHLAMKRYQKIPGFSNLSGHLSFSPKAGQAIIKSRHGQLNFGRLFKTPLSFDQLNSTVNWHQTKQGALTISTKHFVVNNQDLSLDGALDLLFKKGSVSPSLNLLAGFYVRSPQRVPTYLPVSIISPGAVRWLDQAFIGGKPMTGKVIIRGNMAHFPFDKGRGVFSVEAKINDLDLHYAKGWPALKHLVGSLFFDGRSMIVKSTSATLGKMSVDGIRAVIPEMGHKIPLILRVDSYFHSGAKALLDVLKSSPMDHTLGPTLSALTMQGKTKTHLRLQIPLHKNGQAKVLGTTHFFQSTLGVPAWGVELNQLNGDLNFSNNAVTAPKMTANFLGKPAVMTITTRHKPGRITRLTLTSKTTLSQLKQRFKLSNDLPIQGGFPYQAVLDLHSALAKKQNSLTVRTDLSGVRIGLLYPLAKSAKESVPTSLLMRFGNKKSPSFFLTYGKRLSAALSMNVQNKKTQIYSANIHLGEGKAQFLSQPQILVNGTLPAVSFPQWQQMWAHKKKDVHQQAFLDFLKQKKFKANLTIKQFSGFGFVLKDAQFVAKRLSTAWSLGLASHFLDGEMTVPDAYPTSPLLVNLKRLVVPSEMKLSSANHFDPATIPPLDLSIDQLYFSHQHFSNLKAVLRPEKKGVNIKQLTVRSPQLTADLSGSWLLSGNHYQSKVTGSLSSQQFSPLIKQLYPKTNIVAKKAQARVTLAWPSAIYAPTLAALSGDVTLSLQAGWVVDLGKSATKQLNLGKLLTLLSVRHVLTFHVNDLSRNGYSFDSLNTHLSFKKGIIDVDSLMAKGAVADLKAKGLIDLSRRYLNLRLGVSANLGASLPVIATVVGGPVFGPIAGAATWALDKIVHNEMGKHIAYTHHIIGPWSHPDVETIPKKKRH